MGAAGLRKERDRGRLVTEMVADTSLTEASDYLGMAEAVLRGTYSHQQPDFQAEAASRITTKSPSAAAQPMWSRCGSVSFRWDIRMGKLSL
jgi:hypothetical protein